jgi:hypothetical protein
VFSSEAVLRVSFPSVTTMTTRPEYVSEANERAALTTPS